MMSRSFTKREKILLLIMAVLLLGLVYYRFVIVETANAVERYDVSELESELLVEQMKAESKAKMLAEMENGTIKANGKVASYNNIKNEIRELNDILGGTSGYNISFEQAVRSGDSVRRNISITYETSGYKKARAVMKELKNCKYRCMIKDVSFTSQAQGTSGLKSGGTVSINLTVTFYETMVDADTALGLKEEKNEAQVQEGTTEY